MSKHSKAKSGKPKPIKRRPKSKPVFASDRNREITSSNASDLLGAAKEGTIAEHAALVNDPRLTYPSSQRHRENILDRLQSNYGNAYVQRVLAHTQSPDGAGLNPTMGKSARLQGAPTSNLIQRSPQRVNQILRENLSQYRFIQQLVGSSTPGGDWPNRVVSYPGAVENCRHHGIYFDPRFTGEATCRRVHGPPEAQSLTLGSYTKEYITGYPYYHVFMIIGQGALRGSPEGFLSILRHEFEHMRQLDLVRDTELWVARHNRQHHDQLGLLSNIAGTYDDHFMELIPRGEATERRVTAESRRFGGGFDLASHANREVLAHTAAFAQFARATAAALDQLRPLCAVHAATRTSPRWSFDMADENVQNQAIGRVLTAVMAVPRPIETLNDVIFQGLEEVETQERDNGRTPTSFLAELRGACRVDPDDPQGRLRPDPEIALTSPSPELPFRAGGS